MKDENLSTESNEPATTVNELANEVLKIQENQNDKATEAKQKADRASAKIQLAASIADQEKLVSDIKGKRKKTIQDARVIINNHGAIIEALQDVAISKTPQ